MCQSGQASQDRLSVDSLQITGKTEARWAAAGGEEHDVVDKIRLGLIGRTSGSARHG
jgi:hypothetical protein